MKRGVRVETRITKRKRINKRKWNLLFFIDFNVLSKYEDTLRPKLEKLFDTPNANEELTAIVGSWFFSNMNGFFWNVVTKNIYNKKIKLQKTNKKLTLAVLLVSNMFVSIFEHTLLSLFGPLSISARVFLTSFSVIFEMIKDGSISFSYHFLKYVNF